MPATGFAQAGPNGAPSAAAEAASPITQHALAATNFRWRKVETAHAVLYFPAAYTSSDVGRISTDAERAIAGNLAWLGTKKREPKLQLFFVRSRADMRELVGGTPGGSAVETEGTAFFVANDSVRPALRHETMHLLAWRYWGASPANWFSEGLATAAVSTCRGRSTDEIAAILDRAGLLVPLDTLRRAFTIQGERGVVHYYEAASLVSYLDRAYGRDRLRALWRRGGLTASREVLGVDPSTIESEWRAKIRRSPAGTSWTSLWKEIKAHGCE